MYHFNEGKGLCILKRDELWEVTRKPWDIGARKRIWRVLLQLLFVFVWFCWELNQGPCSSLCSRLCLREMSQVLKCVYFDEVDLCRLNCEVTLSGHKSLSFPGTWVPSLEREHLKGKVILLLGRETEGRDLFCICWLRILCLSSMFVWHTLMCLR